MIFVECNPDEVLVIALTGIRRRDLRHELKGKGEICNRLRKVSDCVGLLDEDPGSGQPAYLREASLEEDNTELGLRILRHEGTENRLILLCPRLEEWVLAAAKGAGVDVRQYGLPNDPHQLRRQINLNLGKFGDLVEALRKDSDRLKALGRLLQG